MRVKLVSGTLVAAVLGIVTLSGVSTRGSRAQTPAANPDPAALLGQKYPARLAQLMRGVMLPNSNLLFYAEDNDPAKVPPAKHPSAAINPLEGEYGQWDAVENSSLAIAEAASLLTVPGRFCSNGLPVPVDHADWPKLVDGLRVAAIKSYLAAQSKNEDKLGDAADAVTNACANCHTKYRDKEKLEDRCK